MGAAIQNSVDTSVPTIVRSRVRIPSTPSTVFPFIVKFLLYLTCLSDWLKIFNSIGKIYAQKFTPAKSH